MKHYPRETAAKILGRVLSDHQPLDKVLDEHIGELASETRAWLQEVCSGALRWRGRLDLAIDSIALKKRPSGWLRRMLLIGAYQLVAQDRTPAGRIVSETVAELKRLEGDAPARFGNALLRRIADHAMEWREMECPTQATNAEQARWASLPEWLWNRLLKERGFEWAKSYAKASLDRPELWLRSKDAEWKPYASTVFEKGAPSGAFKLKDAGGASSIGDWPGFSEGKFFIQDISSQTLIQEVTDEVLAASGKPGSPLKSANGLQVLDLCAAPGGKTAGLAWNGFSVSASDRDESRYALLRQTVDRVARGARVIARSEVEALPPQDLVWVDSPCSGTGILRRHPDVRWLRNEGELAQLAEVQSQLIREGWAKVRPGGFFVYSVCSVLLEEGRNRIAVAELPGQEIHAWDLHPQQDPFGDGFWAVLIRKQGD
jgi:16S rRNA (cytosine967-C5)-methyltransferase